MTQEESPLKLMISHSSMETMEQCLYKWFLKYIEKIKVDLPPNEESEFGSFIHDIAESFEGETAKDLKILAKNKIKKYNISANMKKKVPKAIKNFWRYWSKNLKPLNLKKENKERKIFSNTHEEGFRMMGIFDILFRNDNGTVTVIDWKTNKKPRDASKQLSFYFYLLKMVGEIPEHQNTCTFKIVYLCLDATDDVFEVPYELDDLDLDTAAARVDGFIRKIKRKGRDKEKYRKKPGPLCPWCDFYKAGICEGNDAKEED